MHPEHWSEGEGNSVWLEITADGPLGVEYEHSYRIDGGPWSAWTRDTRILVNDDALLLQARHEIEARARVVGEPRSVDETPARAELLVDILAPTLQVARTAGGVRVDADDVISGRDQARGPLLRRRRLDGWGHDWSLELPYDDSSEVSVEVRDEAGNVGRSTAPLIRGLPDASSADGCGCSAPGAGGGGLPLGLLALLGVAGAVIARRRGRRRHQRTFRGRASRALPFLALTLALVATGCECGTPMEPEPCGGCGRNELCCESTDMCVDYDIEDLCDPGYECDPDDVELDDMCGVVCSMCTVRPALQPGILATYLDAIVDEAGAVHVSGYSPGFAQGTSSARYGDLVFGSWDGSSVTWEIVDGAPTMPITNDPSGWRGGVSDPGQDVGRWTSLAHASGTYYISYYDADDGALKLAVGSPGAWQTHTVDDTGDSGRYSSLVLTATGPAIAYLRIQESPEMPGQVVSSVMVASANVATPASPTDWTLTGGDLRAHGVPRRVLRRRDRVPGGRGRVRDPDERLLGRLRERRDVLQRELPRHARQQLRRGHAARARPLHLAGGRPDRRPRPRLLRPIDRQHLRRAARRRRVGRAVLDRRLPQRRSVRGRLRDGRQRGGRLGGPLARGLHRRRGGDAPLRAGPVERHRARARGRRRRQHQRDRPAHGRPAHRGRRRLHRGPRGRRGCASPTRTRRRRTR
ncbi:MAG: hypothetical protein M5U28_27085 [Sandaracinaceae bacterium]|nr:hypothetical protein [Sandaracinaceae bacterium]